MQDDRSLSPRMRSPAGKATDPHPSGTAPDDANGARKGKKTPLKGPSQSPPKPKVAVSPKGKPTCSGKKRKISSESPTLKNANQATTSSAPSPVSEIQSSPEVSKGKALRVRSCSNESTKRRSMSAECATKTMNANIAKIIEQVIGAGKMASSKKYTGSLIPSALPRKERGRPAKKIKIGPAEASNESSSKASTGKAVGKKPSTSPSKSPKVSPSKENKKSTSLSPRRLKKVAEILIKSEIPKVKSEDESPEKTKLNLLLQERVAKSIERVITAINRDDYAAVFMNAKTKEIPKFKTFKKPKNHIKKNLKENITNLKTGDAESSAETEASKGQLSGGPLSKMEEHSLSVSDSPISHRKRGRPKGSKNKVKWDEHGNKILSKGMKKLLKKTLTPEINVPKPTKTKMEVKNMPIKKRDYNHLLLNSPEDEVESSCEKKKPILVKGNKLNKKVATKPKVLASIVSKNKIIKLKGKLKPESKKKCKKVIKLKIDHSSSDSDDTEDKKPATLLSSPSKVKFSESKVSSSESEHENDTKMTVKPKKKLLAKKSTKQTKAILKGKENPKGKPLEKTCKAKNLPAKKENMSDSLSGSDFEDVPIKPPKKALKDKWSREEKHSSKHAKTGIKTEYFDNTDEKKQRAKNTSVTREKQNRTYYFDFDESDLEPESTEDDDDDELYVSNCNVKETKRYKSSNWKMKKKDNLSAPPKRTARMASLNAIAMMACMNEDAKVPLSSLSPCKESSMPLVIKESTIARTHSDVDDDSDSEVEPPPVKRVIKRNSDHLVDIMPKRKKRRGELDVQMDMKDMVVTKRMASLNASAIMAASYSLEPRHKKSSSSISREREVTNVDIQQEISYKSTKSQHSKTRSVITVEETTKKVKKAQGSRETEMEEHIIVKKRVKRQSGINVTDREDGNASDNSELDHEILPKAPEDSGMIVESTITYVTTQTHTAPQSVTLSGVSKYCISSTDGKTTTVVQQVQRKSTTTTNGVAPPTSAPTIPTAHIPPIQHVQVTQPENRIQNPRVPPNYSPLGALEVMQPTMHPPHPTPSHFLNYTPPHHHIQHGIPGAPIHHPHHPHLPPPHLAHHHHIATSPYPPLSPHSPPYPPPPITSSTTSSSSPVCSTTPPSTAASLQPSPQSCHSPSPVGYKSSSPSAAIKPNNSSSSVHAQNKRHTSVDSPKQGGASIPTSSPGPHYREERGRPPVISPTGPGLPNGPSERHHSAFTAPTPTHSPGYQPVSGPMPMGGGSSANGSYKHHQASPGSTPPYSSPSRLTSPPSPSNKSYQPPNPEHYPPHPYQPYPYPPSSYDKYYHPRATSYHLYQSPYPGGQYLGDQGSPEYSFHPPPSGTVHYSQESYTSYTLCVPAPPPHGPPQLPSHPQTLALPPPPTSNASPHHHHQSPPYTTYQYTEFNPGYPYPPAGPPPNPGCCPPTSKNLPSGSLTGGGKGPEGDCRGKNQAASSGSCNNYQYYMTPHPSHPNQSGGYQHPVQAHNAMGHGHPKQYHYPQVESQREPHNQQASSVALCNSSVKVNAKDTNFARDGQNNSVDAKTNSFSSLQPLLNSKPSQAKNSDIVSKSSLSPNVSLPFSETSSSLSTSTTVSSSPASTPLLSIAVTQPSVSPPVTATSSSESSDDTQSEKKSVEEKPNAKQPKPSPPTSSACGKNEIAVPNGKSTLQITTWVVPQSASPVAPSSKSKSATGVSPSQTMLFSPTSTTTSISLPHPYASTNSVMSTTAPVVTSLEKLSLDKSKPKISLLSTNCFDSSIVTESERVNKESKITSSKDSCNKDQTVKKVALSSQRTGGRHLLCQPFPLNHSKTTSVLAKVKPSIIKSCMPVKEPVNPIAQNKSSILNENSSNSPIKLTPSEIAEQSSEFKIPTENNNAKDDECPVVTKKRGRPPKLKDSCSEILKDGIGSNGVASETKPFLQAPGDVNSREDKVPRKRMSLLKSSGAKNSLAVPNSNLKRSKSSPSSQEIPMVKSDLKSDGDLKMINVKTEVLGKIKAEKVSPKNVSLKESGRLKFINGEDDLKSQGLSGKEFKGTFMPPPSLGFDCETQEAFEKKITKLKSEEIEQVSGDNERKIKHKSNESERHGSKSPLDKCGKVLKVMSSYKKGSRFFKFASRHGFNGFNSKVRRKASLLAYLKERNNESDTSVGETECPPSPTKEGKPSKPHPFVNYSSSPGALRGRRTSGTGKGKQIRKLKPYHGWSWDGEAHEGKVWLRNDEENMVRTCYKAMKHKEGDMIRVRDCVLLRSGMKKTDLPYIAKVAALWEDPDTNDMMMSILWYYRPEHTECGRREEDLADEIFASKHRDHLSVACIEDRCYVLTFNEYCRYRRLLRLFQEKAHPTSSPVPDSDDGYFRKERQPPGCVVQDLLFFCRKVYDYRQKRILKNPC